MKNDIQVSRPFMPPQEEFEARIRSIWQHARLTNNGPLVRELEEKLKAFLGIQHMSVVSNGTIGLQLAVQVLELKGEIITTPFSYIASSSSIVWENCTPVFADIDPFSLNIDPAAIEPLITPRTSAILATHIFGNPCKIDQLELLAADYKLKIIYDAAHAFGTSYKGESLYHYGDISVASFHATKIFHTGEGGALFSRNEELDMRIRGMRSFGFDESGEIAGLGINAKMSELHAALGLCNLVHIDKILAEYRLKWVAYYELLKNEKLQLLTVSQDTDFNCSYFPVVFKQESQLLVFLEKANAEGIFPRRYFYPSLNTLPFLNARGCPVSESIATRVACLPLYFGLDLEVQYRIAEIAKAVTNAMTPLRAETIKV